MEGHLNFSIYMGFFYLSPNNEIKNTKKLFEY